jgi:hypothetical protein
LFNQEFSPSPKVQNHVPRPLDQLSREQFVRIRSAVAYLFPGLHPDGFEDADSGWPRVLKRFAVEELYPGDAQWSGLYDRMSPHTADEMERRLALAADYGEAA